MKKIFVGNLPWKVTAEELKTLFEAHGQVISAKVVTDQYTGRSRGFGFVEMADDAGAKKAIDALNDYPMQDRNLRVSLANERQDRPERSSGGGMGTGRREYQGNRERRGSGAGMGSY